MVGSALAKNCSASGDIPFWPGRTPSNDIISNLIDMATYLGHLGVDDPWIYFLDQHPGAFQLQSKGLQEFNYD